MERIQSAALFAQPGYGADASAQRRLRGGASAAVDEARLSRWRRTRRVPLPQALARRFRSWRSAIRRRCPSPTTIPTRSSTSRSPPARRARRRACCTRTTRCSPTAAPWCTTGTTTSARCSTATARSRTTSATVALEQSLVAGCELVVNDLPAGHEAARLDTRDRRDLRDGRADARDRHPRGHEAPRPVARSAQVKYLLHGRLDHPARDGARVSRPRRQAAEHLRHDRERLAPVHACRTTTWRRSRPPAARRATATRRGSGTRRTRTVEAQPGRDRRDRHARRAAHARLFRQPGRDRELVQRRAAGS